MGRFVLGDEDDAAGVTVEPVDDARPILAVELAQLSEAELNGVGQGAAPMSFGGMHDHVGWLVDDRQVLVLIEHLKWNILGNRQVMRRWRRPDADLVAVADLVAGLSRMAVDQDSPGVDDALQRRTA